MPPPVRVIERACTNKAPRAATALFGCKKRTPPNSGRLRDNHRLNHADCSTGAIQQGGRPSRMSLAVVTSRALDGLSAPEVQVEVHLANGLPSFTLVGLADTEVKEARERVRAALAQSGFSFPHNRRITVNLAPADLPKESGRFDLPIALGILAAQELVDPAKLARCEFAGELSLVTAHFSKQQQSALSTIPTYPPSGYHLTTKATSKCIPTGKVKTFDYQTHNHKPPNDPHSEIPNALIVKNLTSAKTHENTGNKPAKQEMNNNHNITPKLQHPYSPHPVNPKIL
eukprot:gene39328-53170_t